MGLLLWPEGVRVEEDRCLNLTLIYEGDQRSTVEICIVIVRVCFLLLKFVINFVDIANHMKLFILLDILIMNYFIEMLKLAEIMVSLSFP